MLGFCPRQRMLVLNGSHVTVISSFLHHSTRTTFKQLLVYSVEKRKFCFTEMFCTVIFKHFQKESFLPTAPSISISELFSTPLFIGLFLLSLLVQILFENKRFPGLMYQLLNLRKQLKTLTKIYRQDINQDFIVHYTEKKKMKRTEESSIYICNTMSPLRSCLDGSAQ